MVSSNVSLRKKPKIVSIWHSQSSRGAVGGGEERATASQEDEGQVEQEEHIKPTIHYF